MKTKDRLFLLAVILLSILFLIGGVRYWVKNQDMEIELNDLRVQLAHSKVPLQRDTIRDSIPVVSQRGVEVDKTDYKQQLADKELIRDLDLKVNQLVSENKMLREARDSVIMKAVNDSVHAYHDRWVDFEYFARLYKHRFLFWRWGTKGYEVKIVNFNPHVDVKYNQHIMIRQ